MGSNLVIVALPDENDRVWKVSSEKVPHLTLLFLGEADKVSNLEQIVEFVQHASDTTLRRFYLSVDRRDTLGPDEADVLFFRKGYDTKAIRDFRSTLLKDNNIRTAYDSATQFEGPWLPHLTLGYPATPAKAIPDNEVDRFYDVSFNKIAVWVEDSDGPEFLLKDYYWDDEMAELDAPGLAMSQINAQEAISQNAARIAAGMEALEHYGTKGMKWGVRHDPKTESKKGMFDPEGHDIVSDIIKTVVWPAVPPLGIFAIPAQVRMTRAAGRGVKAKAIDINEKHFEKQAQTAKNFNEIHKRSGAKFDREIDAINKKYPDAKDPATQKKYDNEVLKLMQDSYKEAANSVGNKANTMHLDVDFRNDGMDFVIKARQGASTPQPVRVKHADTTEDDGEITLTGKILRDAAGHISGFEFDVPTEESMAQTIDLGAEWLEHHGVKGMKWGVRKDRLQEGLHNRRVAAEGVRREKRPAKDIKAYPTIGSSKRQKAKIDTKGGEDHPPTEDAIKVAAARQKLRKSGVHSLSNEELRLVANRLNLEQQVANLESKKVRKSMGRDFVDSVIKDKGNQKTASKFAVKQILKKAGKAGAVAAL